MDSARCVSGLHRHGAGGRQARAAHGSRLGCASHLTMRWGHAHTQAGARGWIPAFAGMT